MAKEVTRKKELSRSAIKQVKLFGQKIDPEAYNPIATNSTLVSVQTIASHFEVNPDFFSKNDKLKIELGHNVLSVSHYEKDNLAVGIFRYEVIAKAVRKHVMCVRADFMVLYEVPEGSAEYESRAFCARVGLFAAYPYFRSLFAHLTSLGQLELPVLPVLSADPLKKTSGKQTAEIER